MFPAPTLVAVQGSAPVQLVTQAALLPAVWKVNGDVPVLVVPMAIVPVPPALLPGSPIVTSTVNVRPLSLMTKPGVGAKTRSGATAPTVMTGVPVTLNALLVTLLNPELDATSV